MILLNMYNDLLIERCVRVCLVQLKYFKIDVDHVRSRMTGWLSTHDMIAEISGGKIDEEKTDVLTDSDDEL
jgi:hypothetical protein